MSATFSQDRKYRYLLWRDWDTSSLGKCAFLMLNPSTANEYELDPTLRRCQSFAKQWGYGGMVIVNLFAIVSSDPRVLLTDKEPIGPFNDRYIMDTATSCGVVVAGWGAFPEARQRALNVRAMLKDAGIRLHCLGTTKLGHPRHPLYLKKTTKLEEWS